MLYLLTTGCQWRLLPKEFPPYTTVQRFFYGWRDDGHLAADQPPPAAGGPRGRGSRGQPFGGGDRQPVGQDDGGRRAARLRRGQEDQGPQAPYPDRYQRVAGRGDGARRRRPGPRRRGAAAGSIRRPFPWLRHVFADGGYAGAKLQTALAALGNWTLQIVKRSDTAQGFELLPRRWVVERTLAWLNRNRRLAKDFEALAETATAWLMLASVKLLSRRLAQSIINLLDIESGSQSPSSPHAKSAAKA